MRGCRLDVEADDFVHRAGKSARLALNCAVSLLQAPQVGSNACGIFAEVAFPKARDRAYVDAAAAVGATDADNDVVFESEPDGRIGCFDPSFIRHRGDNLPAKVARSVQGALERRIRRFDNRGWLNVRIRRALLARDVSVFILERIGGAFP